MMRRRRGGGAVVVLVVAALSAAAVATPVAAQEGEPRVELTVHQVPNRLSLSALGCPFAPGSPVRITFSGGGGDSREFSKRVRDDTCFLWTPNDLDPCRLGASDLPGTQFRVGVEVPSAPYSLDQLITLEPDTTKPRFLDPPFDSSPRPGSRVEVGDEIDFEVTATDKTPAKSWQTGVHSLQVTGPQGLVGEPKDGGRRPKACGQKSKSLTVRGTHRVKRSDPPVIELCAITEDYVPNENTKCKRWYKGEVWEGTISGPGRLDGGTCAFTARVDGTLTLVVDNDGKVTGDSEVTYTFFDECGDAGPPAVYAGQVRGRATDDAFQIGIQGYGDTSSPIAKVSPTRARAEIFVGTGPGNGYDTTLELRCLSCGDEAVG